MVAFHQAVAVTALGAPFRNQNFCFDFLWVHTRTRAAHSSRLKLSASAEISKCESLFSPYCVFAKVQIPIFSGCWPTCLGILFLSSSKRKREWQQCEWRARKHFSAQDIEGDFACYTHALWARTDAHPLSHQLPPALCRLCPCTSEKFWAPGTHTDSRLGARTS